MTSASPAPPADISFYFDPVCPFARITSKWIRTVAAQRDYAVDWRFISLRLINAGANSRPDTKQATSGLRLLRVAAWARAEHEPATVGPFYQVVSSEIFDSPGAAGLTPQIRGSRAFTEPLLARAGLPAGLADASWDAELQAETDHALSLTGKGVGTPIIQFQPPTAPPSSARSSAAYPPTRTPSGSGTTSLPSPRPPASPNSSAASASAPARQLRHNTRPGRHRGRLAGRQQEAGLTPPPEAQSPGLCYQVSPAPPSTLTTWPVTHSAALSANARTQ